MLTTSCGFKIVNEKSNQNFFASTKKLKKNLNSIDFTQIESGIKKMINYI